MDGPRVRRIASRPALARGPLFWLATIRFAVPVASTLLVPVGYTADELYYLACADQLAWGYVDHPPLSIAVLAGVQSWLGDSLLALRVVPALCEALAVVATGLLTRELGGGRRAQLVAALAMATAPMALAIGLPFSMNPLEHLLWPAAALVLARLLNGADTREWLVLGLLLGLALMNKLSTLWLGVGLAAGLAVSPARTWLATPGPWLAAAIAAGMLAPHLAWQVANDWPTAEFIRHNATGREGLDAAVAMHSPAAFAVSQLVAMGPLAAPLWLLGLERLLRSADLRRHRALGWTFVVVFVLLAASGRASVYYLVGAFPMVFAAGGVAIEKLARGRARRPSAAVATALVFQGVVLLPVLIPVVEADHYLTEVRRLRRALGADPEAASLPPSYAWMLGGPELARTVARVADALPAPERRRAGVLATTFGEAGALAHFGPEVGLPTVIGTHNNFWLWGTRGLDGSVLIVVTDAEDPLLQRFASCQLEARTRCPHCEPRFQRRPVFVCREPSRPLPELWPDLKDFV